MKKRLISLLLVLAMVVCLVPAQTRAAETATVDNSKIKPDSDGYAICPVCEKSVKWTAVSGERTSAYWLSDGGHYYLSGNLSSSGSDGAITVNSSAGNAACLHLNGYDITSSASCTVTYYQSSPGTLNIMGNGTVSGSGVVAATNWKAATLNVTNGAMLNLYGGTYTKGSSDAPVIWAWAGEVNMYDGAQIVGTSANVSAYSSAILLQNAGAAFHMYGGEISGGHNTNSGGNVCINNGSFTMSGGTISGGTAVNYHGGNVYLKAGTFTMSGGTVSGGSAAYYGGNVYVNAGAAANISGGTITNGNLYVSASGTTTLSGAPVIEELKLPADVTVTLDGMTAGVDVAVSASGVFTNTGVAAYVSCFRAVNGTDSIMAGADGALRYVSNANLSFEEGTTNAYCPVCAQTVSWTAVSGALSSTLWTKGGTHYYLSGDVTYDVSGTGEAVYSPLDGTAACLHLNGYSLTATTGKAIHCGGILNIMGSGTVSGNNTEKYGGATVNTWGNGTLNLYGGTFTKGASQYPVIFVNAFTVNLFSGATVDGTGTTPSGYALVYAENASAVLNMYGGTVRNGTSTGACGNVRMYAGSFNMYGGTVTGGTGTVAGNVYLQNTGKANLSGGKVTNGSVYPAASDALTLSGAPKVDALVVPADVTVKVDTLTQGAQISISADCAVTTDADLQAYVDAGYFVTPLEGKIVAAEDGMLVIQDAPVEEPETPENNTPTYILGDVLYETDFESDTVGALPEGWSAGYSEGSAEDGTLTGFGWGDGGSMTAQVEEFGDYGNAYHFGSTNNDAFTAMPEIGTMNYLYEAEVYVERGGSIGMANNFYAPTDEASGAMFTSIYLNGDPAKYTYKGVGAATGVLWDTSYTPEKGEVIKLQILSLNGKNHIMYNSQIAAVCNSRTGAGSVDHPGFYACYGGAYILNVKVTEVFAADMQIAAARIGVANDKSADLTLEIDFDKDQGIYTQLVGGDYAYSEAASMQFGAVILAGDSDVSASLDKDTEGATVINFTGSNITQSSDNLRFTTALDVPAENYRKWYSVRPFTVVNDVCFYADGEACMPANLANGAYLSTDSENEKALIAEVFGSCENFTAASASKELTFTLFSDFHYIEGMYSTTIGDLNGILKRADDSNSAFILSAGDFTNSVSGSPELFNAYLNYTTAEGKLLPAYNIYGNHELEGWVSDGNGGVIWDTMAEVTPTLTNNTNVVWGTEDGTYNDNIGYYYFESEGFRIICLDTQYSQDPDTLEWVHNLPGSNGPEDGNINGNSCGPVQLAWLESVLMDAAGKDIPCIVVSHDGYSGLGWATTNGDAEELRAIFSRVNGTKAGTVLMSISGHTHTNHQGWNDGVFYFDVNTTRNNWWWPGTEDHYTDEHTFTREYYDDEGNLLKTEEVSLNTLSQGKNTWFSEDALSCVVTISETGEVTIDGQKSQWAYGIVPDAAATVSGVECEISSGTYWDCSRDGHLEQLVTTETERYTVCDNEQCAYESTHQSHSGMVLQLADGAVTFSADSAAAVTAHLENPGSYIKLLADGTSFELPEGESVYMDFNGKTANITGSGTLCGMDSTNDAYKLSTGAAKVADTVTVQPDVTGGENDYRYIAVQSEDGSYSFHRLNMRLTTVSLRTSACGIYYKAQYECDDVLAAKVSSYGVVFSVNNMPGADFMTEADDINRYTRLTPGANFGDSTVATSGAVFNIMKTSYTDTTVDIAATNAARGAMEIYANAYVCIDGEMIVADAANENKTVDDKDFSGVAYSLLDVLKAIDTNWDKYAAAGQDGKVKEFYAAWNGLGMSTWADQLTNIDA